MHLVVGLGNPGPDYADTRHNLGWWVVERLAQRWSARPHERTAAYRSWIAEFAERPVTLLEPLTYMNVSGEAVRTWREHRGPEAPDGLLVIADDVYLPVGLLRLRPSGASGGHKGLENIEQELGTRDYARLRIGVGAAEGSKLADHVLAEPEGDERRNLEAAADLAADAVEVWMAQGIHSAMNRFNRKATKEVSES